jgi:hypothetical protein
MRKLLTLFLAFVACTLCAFAAGPKIEFTETTYDFGTIKEENGAVTHVFEFKNTGDEKLVIISAIASCGCTTPKYPTEPIAPGATGKIKVTYNPSGESVDLRVVKSMVLKRNLYISLLLFSSKWSAIIFSTSAFTVASLVVTCEAAIVS